MKGLSVQPSPHMPCGLAVLFFYILKLLFSQKILKLTGNSSLSSLSLSRIFVFSLSLISFSPCLLLSETNCFWHKRAFYILSDVRQHFNIEKLAETFHNFTPYQKRDKEHPKSNRLATLNNIMADVANLNSTHFYLHDWALSAIHDHSKILGVIDPHLVPYGRELLVLGGSNRMALVNQKICWRIQRFRTAWTI